MTLPIDLSIFQNIIDSFLFMDEKTFYIRAIISCSVRVGIWLVVCTALMYAFIKAGLPAGYAYIPIVCESYMFRLAGKKNMFWFYFGFFCLEFLCAIPAGIAAFQIFKRIMDTVFLTGNWMDVPTMGFWLWCLLLVIMLAGVSFGATGMKVFKVFMCIGTCKNFGQGVIFTIGMILFYDIFSCILGFNKNMKYVGPPIPLRPEKKKGKNK